MDRMSSSTISTADEVTPLVNNDNHSHQHGHPHRNITVQNPRQSVCRVREETSSSATDSMAPCAKYGTEEGLTNSAIQNSKRAKRKLIIACILCLFFLVGEFVGR